MSLIRSKGERALIEYALKQMTKSNEMLLPPGDDAAAIPIGKGKALVMKTDFLSGLTDVPPGMSTGQVGWKTVTMNVSDLVAKGARPLATLFSLALPPDYTFEGAKELVSALFEASRFYGAEDLGGDTGEAEGLLIAGMAIGMADGRELMRRDGAKPGDILAVTGNFGKTALGLKILLKPLRASGEVREEAIDSVYNPRARLKEGLALAKSHSVTSSTDSSDGLAWSLHELSEASGVGFVINSLPITKRVSNYAGNLKLDPFNLTFYGGEEYELVVTIRSKDWVKAQRLVSGAGGRLIPVGKVTKRKRLIWAPKGGTEREIEPLGYEHFRNRK
jgi:thiamine-monophosphate kinase